MSVAAENAAYLQMKMQTETDGVDIMNGKRRVQRRVAMILSG